MALKALMLRKKIDEKKKLLEKLRAKSETFRTRESELEQAITEAETDEEQAAVEAEIESFESDKQENDTQISNLETEISGMEQELESTEQKQRSKTHEEHKPTEGRKADTIMNTRTKFFGMTVQERDAFFARTDVKEWLERLRAMGREKRSVTGTDLMTPEIVLSLIKENIDRYSKLYKHLNVRSVPGKARQNIMGTVPEAVWTEMCGASLNELNLSFAEVELDGYKVGGYIAVCNAVLEDSDIALASEIISALGQAIGYALDKASIYGTGIKMPLGIVTRLCQTSKPSDYPSNARAWKDLSTSNVISITGKTDAALFKELTIASGNAKGTYSRGEKFWVMNDKTYTKLVANALSINAAGAIVTGQTGTMPIIGGIIETLDFIPDDVIIGGYGDLYLLAERAGTTISQSEHAFFLSDQTVFKGTARYDGAPVIPEGFVAIGINGNTPTAAMTFAPDTANTNVEEETESV